MTGIDAVDAIIILSTLLAGIGLGVIVVVSAAIKREDRRFSLSGQAPDFAARGTRMLLGYGSRGTRIWDQLSCTPSWSWRPSPVASSPSASWSEPSS
jgi:hypothetical protein